MNEGEAVHPDRVRIHLARVRRTLRALRAFISPKEAGTPVTSHLGKEGGNLASWSLSLNFVVTFARLSESPLPKANNA
jgi:hypothetical protein